MQQQLADLQARIAKLESTDAQKAAAQTKAEVLRDAERRSTLGPVAPLTAGYDKGFFIRSEDSNFLFKPALQTQFRYVANSGEDADGDEEFESGFELRRTRFRFDGNAFSPDFTYSFVFDTNRSGGNVSLLEAWAGYKFAEARAVQGVGVPREGRLVHQPARGREVAGQRGARRGPGRPRAGRGADVRRGEGRRRPHRVRAP